MSTIDLRHKKDGSVSYRVRLRKNGQKNISITFLNMAAAKDFIEKYEDAFMSGKNIVIYKSCEIWIDER